MKSEKSPFPFSLSSFHSLRDVEFRWHEPLAHHTTFRVGGPVLCLANPKTEDSLVELMRIIRKDGVPYLILGEGSNVLAPDHLLNAVAIQLAQACAEIRRCEEKSGEGIRIYAGAGLRLARCLGFCLRHRLSGMESLVGIPGTIGGALIMNAGTAQGCIADSLIWIECLDSEGRRRRLFKSELTVKYRSIELPKDWVVLGACFRLTTVSDGILKSRLRELIKKRKLAQPLGYPSAGCAFKNPPHCSAGLLIDKVGLKGFRIGDAQISEKHANWIINRGNAESWDILALLQRMEDEVFAHFGIRLEREIRVLES